MNGHGSTRGRRKRNGLGSSEILHITTIIFPANLEEEMDDFEAEFENEDENILEADLSEARCVPKNERV